MPIDETLKEFDERSSLLDDLAFDEADSRLSGFYEWLVSDESTRSIIDSLNASIDVDGLLKEADYNNPPRASTLEQVAALGLFFMSKIREGALKSFEIGFRYGIQPPYNTNSVQDSVNEVLKRYIVPAMGFIRRELVNQRSVSAEIDEPSGVVKYPPEISDSLNRFTQDHPQFTSTAFIIVRFGETKAHGEITKAIRDTLRRFGISGLRADDKQYHDDLLGNVLTYIYGCKFGIAVFERLEQEDFSPNVAFEVGYMRALNRSVCLLKDKNLKTLHTDLIGKLYKSFDTQAPSETIPPELEKWLRDLGIVIAQ